MLAEDTAQRGEYDGVDAPKEMGEGAIHPSERHGGAACAKGVGETAEGIVLPRCWEGETCTNDIVRSVVG
jgi:hypothetical protein